MAASSASRAQPKVSGGSRPAAAPFIARRRPRPRPLPEATPPALRRGGRRAQRPLVAAVVGEGRGAPQRPLRPAAPVPAAPTERGGEQPGLISAFFYFVPRVFWQSAGPPRCLPRRSGYKPHAHAAPHPFSPLQAMAACGTGRGHRGHLLQKLIIFSLPPPSQPPSLTSPTKGAPAPPVSFHLGLHGESVKGGAG